MFPVCIDALKRAPYFPAVRTKLRPSSLTLLLLATLCACGADADDPALGAASGLLAPDPFADRVVSFEPGDSAGFGQDAFPEIVLGAPQGNGLDAGSLDVLSLGRGGIIVLEFTDMALRDGPGPDLLVFENAFNGWTELGQVAVSEDGQTWHEWPCDPSDPDGDDSGCAGHRPVLSNSDNDLDPTDPHRAGGDAFDLADLGIETARFVRITDTGTNFYAGKTGGFDLDAVAVVHADEP